MTETERNARDALQMSLDLRDERRQRGYPSVEDSVDRPEDEAVVVDRG